MHINLKFIIFCLLLLITNNSFCLNFKLNVKSKSFYISKDFKIENNSKKIFFYTKDSINFTKYDNIYTENTKLKYVLGTEAFLYLSTMTGLYYSWYKDYDLTKFHFFNDNKEWLQMDKFGHITTSYIISKLGYDMMRFINVDNKKATLYGAPYGLIGLTTVEIFDGFSKAWGFSVGDEIANITGTAIFMSQQLIWKEQRIICKYSFHQTKFSGYRPDLLGNNIAENMFKDYNGITNWYSVNLNSFFKSFKPVWLNIAFGYSAEGLMGGFDNPAEYNGDILPQSKRYRQYFVAFDISLSKIKTKSEFLKNLFNAINVIKIPMPAIEYNTYNKFKLHAFYF